MSLPKWATTVTPLSKTFALIIFIIFPVISFMLGIKYQKFITSPSSLQIERLTTNISSSNSPITQVTNIPTKVVSAIKDDYGYSDKLIKDMKVADSVPTEITLSNGDILTLYTYKEPKRNPYCSNEDNSPSCQYEQIYGDYLKESGYNCMGNPFYNPMNKSTNKSGHYYNFDADNNTVPSILNNYYVLKDGNNELFTGGSYEIFQLKDKNNKCHPYKLKFGYLSAGIPPNDRKFLSAVRFNVPEPKIASISYSDYRFGCAGSRSRLIENNKTLLNYLIKEIELENGVTLYSLSNDINYDYNNFSFNFISSVTTKQLQDGGFALLSTKSKSESDILAQKNLLQNLSKDKSIIFVKDPIFPDIFFVYISFENTFYSGC